MMGEEDVISIYQALSLSEIQVWLTGGWGIDALLQRQTRPHKDIDIIMMLDDVDRMLGLLAREGYRMKELWSENKLVVNSSGIEIPTAFVLWDLKEHEVDAHAIQFDENGNGIPSWVNDEGLVFSKEDLAGNGNVASVPMRCISPRMQVLCHKGYDLPIAQKRDLELLRDRFGVECSDI